MEDKNFTGNLVYLTGYFERWLKELNSDFNVPMINRLARVVKVFDWGTEEGKLLLEEREKTGKWKNLDSKLFKFVLKIYYPDLELKSIKGVAIEELTSRYYPGSQSLMFDLIPEKLLTDILKKDITSFTIEKKPRVRKIIKKNVSK